MTDERFAPNDEHDQRLRAHVHPPDWENPSPARRYNLVVLGAGTAGLVTAAAAAGLGARVAIVERARLGGDCLNFGCVPSKALIRSARAAASLRDAAAFGIQLPSPLAIDFSRVMTRLRRLRSELSAHDSARRFRDLGVDVFFGRARFRGRTSLEVDGLVLRFRKAVIATGSRPAVPSIPGLEPGEFLTNETIFSLTEKPSRLAVIGGGPIGCELAQAFQRLGSRVTIIEQGPQLLPREDPDAAELLRQVLKREGLNLYLDARVKQVENLAGTKMIQLNGREEDTTVEADQILVATGRQANIEDLGLRVARIRFGPHGIQTNARLQTTNPRVYVAGDVGLAQKFTHAADASARMVLENALFFGSRKVDRLNIPWCTFTSPEIAHAGISETEAEKGGMKIATYKVDLATVDRAVLDGQTEGFAKLIVRRGSDQIIGATIVAENAGDMINEITLAMDAGLGLKNLSALIHPYPTQAEAIRKAADAYQKGRLTPFVRRILGFWFRLSR